MRTYSITKFLPLRRALEEAAASCHAVAPSWPTQTWRAGFLHAVTGMELVAGRFLKISHQTFDLATGEEVVVRRSAAGPAAGQQRWSDRCATLTSVFHPNLVALVDYGFLGVAQRFEAYARPRLCALWAQRDGRAAGILRSVACFLHERALLAGGIGWARLVSLAGEPCVDPDTLTGTRIGDDETRSLQVDERRALERLLPKGQTIVPSEVQGRLVEPPLVVRRLAEAIEAGRPGCWRQLTIRVPPAFDQKLLLRALVREARLAGFVPVALRLFSRWLGLRSLLADFHVLFIVEGLAASGRGSGVGDELGALLALGLTNARPNVLLNIHEDPACVEPVLVTSVVFDRPRPRAITDTRPTGTTSEWGSGLRVAEAGESYRTQPDALAAVGFAASEVAAGWHDSATPAAQVGREKTGLRAVAGIDRGLQLARRGLHAAAERELREAVGVLARRGEGVSAGRALLILGGLLLERGRTRDAVAALESARRWCERGGWLAGATRATACVGLAWTDEGRLVEAEAALRAVLAGAEALEEVQLRRDAALGLARCLLWQGRYDDAALLAAPEDADRVALARAHRLSARIALAQRDLRAAGTHAAAALDAAASLADCRDLASAHAVMAAVQGGIGNLEAVREHVARGLVAARAAHAPLRALRLRVTLLEELARARRWRELRPLAVSLGRYRLESIPPLLRARLHMALAEAAPVPARSGLREAVEAFVLMSGARALVPAGKDELAMDVIRDVIDVLHICQEADDEQVALSRVCSAVRERAGASVVVVCAADPPDGAISSAGHASEARPAVARRAIEAGALMPPGDYGDGVEAAAPVRYAGRTIGALACRWLPGGTAGSPAVAGLLSAAATACAPSLQAVLDRRATANMDPGDGNLGLLGVSSAVAAVRSHLLRAAATSFPVLIEGESGSGKELVARAIHRLSRRRDRRFCPLNCAALTDELLEAELFGHARGAFTGATIERAGLFEEADRGVIFLDEVTELSPRAQAKLLRVLQEGEIRRVGEAAPRRVDVRVLAATNHSLAAEVAAGRFRSDLLFRLDVVRITVPPLRERPEDVPVLAAHFWRLCIEQTGSRATLDPGTLAVLSRYDWPGNVRELQNAMAALAVNAPRRGRVTPNGLPAAIAGAGCSAASTLEEARQSFERRFVRAALARAGGRRGQAAADLGLSRQGFAKLVKRLGLEDGDSGQETAHDR